ncbi:MAG: tol-pal system protein YbgF [Rhodospirillales bacterium]|nr:tol-pal system protein YbgF [Rhodospirillales bacterium]
MSRLSQMFRLSAIGMAFGVTIVALSSTAFAQQQNIQPLLDRLERLERDIRTLNVQLSRGEKPTPFASSSGSGSVTAADGSAIARLGARMDGFETDTRAATGTVEFVNHQIVQINERLEKLVSDVDYRLSALEGRNGQNGNQGAGSPGMSAGPSPAGVQTVAPASGSQSLGTVPLTEVDKIEKSKEAKSAGSKVTLGQNAAQPASPKGVLPAGTVKEQYTFAINLLRQTNYEQAEVALKEFLIAHRDEDLANNARYWLGETYYVRRSYQAAAQIFFEGFSKDTKGPKAAASLLKLGMSLAGLDKNKEACATFSKVLADFPKALDGVKNAVSLQRKRNSCP